MESPARAPARPPAASVRSMQARLREITRDYKPLTSATKTTAMIPGLVNGRPSKIGEQRWDLECFHHRTRYGRADVCGPTLLSPHGSSRHASSRHALITRYDCFPTVMSQRMQLRRHISVSRNGLSCRLLPPKLVYRPAFLHRPHTLRKNGAASAGPIEALSLSPYACPGDRVGVNGAVWGRSDWLTTWMMCYAIPTMMEKTRSQRLADKAKAEQLRCRDWLLTFMQNNHAKLWTKAELREVAILTAVARPSLGSLAALAFDSFRRKSSHRLPSRLTSARGVARLDYDHSGHARVRSVSREPSASSNALRALVASTASSFVRAASKRYRTPTHLLFGFLPIRSRTKSAAASMDLRESVSRFPGNRTRSSGAIAGDSGCRLCARAPRSLRSLGSRSCPRPADRPTRRESIRRRPWPDGAEAGG